MRRTTGAALAMLAAIGVAYAAPVRTEESTPGPFEKRVEVAAVAAARESISAPDRFEVERVRYAGASRSVEAEALDLVLAEVVGPQASGIARVRFRLLENGQPVGEARATVHGRVMGPALRAVETLPRGSRVAPESVEVVECDLTRLPAPPLREPGELAGRVPLRTLGRGRVIDSSLLEPEPRVRRGDRVDVAYVSERLSIATTAVVLDDGVVGETVEFENVVSGAVQRGRVREDGTLVVEGGRTRR